jgi:GntR family transcriptional regulator / MocR family aminotransferase
MAKTKRSTPPTARAAPNRSGGAQLLIALDRRRRTSLQRQVYTTIRQAILSGRLATGSRLPTSRSLAEDLSVSRTTVVLAYEMLDTEGFIEGRGSAGSFVARLDIGHPARRGGASPAGARPRSAASPARVRDDARARHTLDLSREASGLQSVKPAPVPFRIGEPAIDLFPTLLWARLYARRARRSGASLLGYGASSGHAPLRAAIAGYVTNARGVNATADQVIITRGTQQAVHLAARALLSPGDSVWVEDPGYLTARAIFRHAGVDTVPVPVDAEGIVVAQGIDRAPNARAAYVSPSHQFPLGAMMSLPRRLALIEWAVRAGAWILEDDFDSEFRYGGVPLASLQGLDTMDRVIYAGTFSKTMFPSLRLGYLIVPADLVDLFRAAQAVTDHVAPNLDQATLAEFIEHGHFTRHVRQMRAAYAARQDALMRCVARELGDVIDVTPADTGMHVIGWLRDRDLDDAVVSRTAWEAGVEASAVSRYSVRAKCPPGLLLGFAAIRPTDMSPAARLLGKAIRQAQRG